MSDDSQRIMYVCSECADNNPEGCGHFDRNDLRVLPGGQWLCEGCFDDTTSADRDEDADEYKGWCKFSAPPEFVASQKPPAEG